MPVLLLPVPATGAGTWTWSSTDPITWNWIEVLAQGVYFLPHEAATITTPQPTFQVEESFCASPE